MMALDPCPTVVRGVTFRAGPHGLSVTSAAAWPSEQSAGVVVALKHARASQHAHVRAALALPAGSVWMRPVAVAPGADPLVEGRQLAAQDLPHGPAELAASSGSGPKGVPYVAVAPISVIEASLAELDEAGFTPVALHGRALALAAAAGEAADVLILAIEDAGTHLVAARAGWPVAERETATGLADIARVAAAALGCNAERALERMQGEEGAALKEALAGTNQELASEAELLLHLVESADGSRPQEVLLAGAGAGVPGLAETLERALRMKVSLLDPFRGMVLEGDIEALSPERRAAFAVAAGIARLSSIRSNVPDLLPSSRRTQQRFNPKRVAAVAAAVLFAVATGGAWWWVETGPLTTGRAEKARLEASVRQREVRQTYLAKLRAERADIEEHGKTLAGIAASRVPWTRKLDEFWQVTHASDVAGSAMWISNLSVKPPEVRAAPGKTPGGQQVKMQGFCLAGADGDALQRFNDFHERLKESAFYRDGFEALTNPAGKAVEFQDGRSAWSAAIELQLAAKAAASPAAVAKGGGK